MAWTKNAFAGVLGAALLTASAALAATASETIALRKGNFKEIGGAFKTVNDELRASSPDMNSLRPAAQDLATRARQSVGHFPKGTGPEAGVPTRALPAIWRDTAGFKAVQNQFVASADKLNAAVKARNAAAMEAARRDLGASCKTCHTKFRRED